MLINVGFNRLTHLKNVKSCCSFCRIRHMSSTMKAVQIQTTGDPSVLKIETVPIPEIKPNEVLVKIHAAGLNPVDTYIRQKKFGYDPKLPAILGLEAAGEISKVGTNTGSKYKVGDRVICCLHGNQNGGYAEFTACDVESLIPLPDKLSFSQGAAVYVPYFTAYKALIARCKLQPKELVMINGASGAVGVAALQIAKAHGAVVAASAGSVNGLKLIQANGADIVVDHRDDGHLQKALIKSNRPGFDVIFENRADINLGSDLDVLGIGGRIAVVGSRGTVQVDPRNFIRSEGCVLGVHLQKTSQVEFKEYSNALVEGMKSGWLNPVVGREYSMNEIQKAHEDLIVPHGACGKKVLLIK